jgi:tetratricopeptide (TPR) repeat protein
MEINDQQRQKIGSVLTELANVGSFLREQGYYDRAIQVFLTLSEGDKTFEAGAYAYEIGLCYQALQRYQDAKKYFDIAFTENPDIPEYRTAAARYGSDT